MHSVDELKQRLIQFWSFQAHFMNSQSLFTIDLFRATGLQNALYVFVQEAQLMLTTGSTRHAGKL